MGKKILFFYGNNPNPPRSGSHQRCLVILKELKNRGHKIYFLSADFSSEQVWADEGIEKFKQEYVDEVIIYKISWLCRWLTKFISAYYKLLKRCNPPLDSIVNTPQEMRRWFKSQFKFINPNIIYTNYAFWHGLVSDPIYLATPKIIDTHDLVSLNRKIRETLDKKMKSDEKIWQEQFWDNLNLLPDKEEFRIYDNYDYTLAISPLEYELIKDNSKKTKTILLPITCEAIANGNNYRQEALFIAGDNIFNIHGYLYFLKKVMPIIKKDAPDFLLQIIGSLTSVDLPKINGVVFKGQVENLKIFYENAGFFICPILAGTGQQVKVIEAMANGLPVIIERSGLRGLPVQHSVNGFIANDNIEFASYTLKLWQSVELRKSMGQAARQTILDNFSKERLGRELNKIEILR